MRILRLRAYFDPENVSASSLANDMDEAYARNGITVVNYTPMPTRGVSDEVRKQYKKKKYEELRDGHVIVHRFSMFREGRNPIQRAFRYLCCFAVEYHKGVSEKDIDLVHCGSTPPTQGLLGGLVAKKLSKKLHRKVPFVYNLQDIFPDSLVNAGMTKKGSLLWKIGRAIEDKTYRNADRIIGISESFRQNLLEKGVPEEKIEIVPNWIDLDAVNPVGRAENRLFDECGIDRNQFVVLYAGNLGEMQGADVILDAAEKLKDENGIRFVIFGGGSCFDSFRQRAEKLPNVSVFPLLPVERVSEVYSMGDLALITCKPGSGGAAMPSKTWSIMACGTPIVASFDTDSEFARVISLSGAGKCVEPGNAGALAEAIREGSRKKEKTEEKSKSIREYAIRNASKTECVKKYLRVLMDAAETENEMKQGKKEA